MGKLKVLTGKVRKKIKKLHRKLKRVDRQYLNRKKYFSYRENLPIDESAVLLETLNGQSPDGNINALLKELTTEEEYQKSLDLYANDENLMTTLSDDNMKTLMLESMQSTMRIKVNDTNDISSIKNF